MKLSDIVSKVIPLASQVREYYEAELPKRHPLYPIVRPEDPSVPPSAEEIELRNFLGSLPAPQLYQLMLIMYLGRGGFSVSDLAEQYADLEATFGDTQQAISQMIDKAPLADYLCDGLEMLREHQLDVNALPLQPIQAQQP